MFRIAQREFCIGRGRSEHFLLQITSGLLEMGHQQLYKASKPSFRHCAQQTPNIFEMVFWRHVRNARFARACTQGKPLQAAFLQQFVSRFEQRVT